MWRAIDQNGEVLVQPRRDLFAALRFFHKLLRQLVTSVIITDRLRSYAAAKRIIMPRVAHRQHRSEQSGRDWSMPSVTQP
jgi:putative transposase